MAETASLIASTVPSTLADTTLSDTPNIAGTSTGTGEAGEHTYKFNIAMSCGGCSGAVDRVLKKMDGIKTHNVSLPDQTATVVVGAGEELSYEEVLKAIKKTGKKVLGGERDGVGMGVDVGDE